MSALNLLDGKTVLVTGATEILGNWKLIFLEKGLKDEVEYFGNLSQ